MVKYEEFDGLTPKRFTTDSVRLYCNRVWQYEPLIAKKIASELLSILAEAYVRKPFFLVEKVRKGF